MPVARDASGATTDESSGPWAGRPTRSEPPGIVTGSLPQRLDEPSAALLASPIDKVARSPIVQLAATASVSPAGVIDVGNNSLQKWDLVTLLFVVIAVIVVALIFDFTNGFHDSANAMAGPVATGALKPRTAVLIAAVLNLVGAFLSTEVASGRR